MDRQEEAGEPTETSDEEPLPNRLSSRSLDGEINRDAEKRVSQSIVRRGLGSDDSSQINWHMLMSVLSTCGQRVIHFINAYPTLGEPRLARKHLPTMAAEITGSVGVRHADIAKQDIKLSEGKSRAVNPGEMCRKPFTEKGECTHQQQRTIQSPWWGQQARATPERASTYMGPATRFR